MLMTSGYNFEGYTITEYLGVYSGECALGTGFLSSLGAGISDILGTNSKMYSNKLREAKDFAMKQLQDQVISAGGNAIIGLDIDYVSFSSDIMGVVATGTAVKLNSITLPLEDSSMQKCTISRVNSGLPFKVSAMYSEVLSNDNSSAELELFYNGDCSVTALMADICFTDIFQREITVNDIVFSGFHNAKRKYFISAPTCLHISSDVIQLLSSVQITIKKYVSNEGFVDLSDVELQYDSLVTSQSGESDPASSQLALALLAKAETLKSAKEIYDFVVSYNDEHFGSIDPQLINILDTQKDFERFYGNNKIPAIKEMKKFLGIEE